MTLKASILEATLTGADRVNNSVLFSDTFACLIWCVYFHLVVVPSAQTAGQHSARSQLMSGHGSLVRLPRSVCVCTVQTLCCSRGYQRPDCQLSYSLLSGEKLRDSPQEGHPPSTRGLTKSKGSVDVVVGHRQRFLECDSLEIHLMQVTNGKVPTSILKRPSPTYGTHTEPNHRRKGKRRVRFREPETTVHGENTDSFANILQPAQSWTSQYTRVQRSIQLICNSGGHLKSSSKSKELNHCF